MTDNKVETALDRTFSEPPIVTVKSDRTHCEACKEALDPTVMHKCHGNQEYQPPVHSHTEITEPCPVCEQMTGAVHERTGSRPTYTVVCTNEACRTFLGPEVHSKEGAILYWNIAATSSKKDGWPVWRADLPKLEDAR